MKKRIGTRLYDTATATFLAKYEDYSNGNLNYIEEHLYRKRSGEYFLYGEGGARTVYGTYAGFNTWTAGREIVRLTESKARDWAEEHLTAEEYIAIFGEVAE